MTTLLIPTSATAPPATDLDRAVVVRGLTKSYAGRTVVDRLDLDVRTGEVLGLIGANGAGKTTTVECLQGLRRPDAGSVRVLGFDPARQSGPLRALLGSQLQDSGLPDRIRVEEALRLFAGPRADAARTASLLDRFGLDHRRRLAFGTMSGGERQRLFLVLALLNRPRLVILDELTQGLDPSARREVWASVRELRDAGTTVLLVTHELEDAERLCDRVVVMRSGHVLDVGTPSELVARHAATATVRFTLADVDDAALRGLPGAQTLRRDGDVVTLTGRRELIAHTGAWLVARGAVPPDLHVDVPDLEEALLGLLDAPTRTTTTPTTEEN